MTCVRLVKCRRLSVLLCILLFPTFSLAQVPCDFSSNGQCNVNDVDALANAISAGRPEADVDEDGDTDVGDLEFFLANAMNRLNGDFDLRDGADFPDFLRLSSNFGDSGSWSDGDANADGSIGFPDFLIFADNFGNAEPTLVPSVSVEVTEDDGLFTYTYTIENAEASPAGINVLFLDVADGEGVVNGELTGLGQYRLDAPAGWTGDYLENSSGIEEVAFIQASGADCGTPGILLGGDEQFTIESEFGPGERLLFAGNLVTSCDYFFASSTVSVLAPTVPPGFDSASVPEPATPVYLLALAGLFARQRQRSGL